MNREGLHCWKCGAPLDHLLLPMERRAECHACRAELHVCRQCRFYDTSVAKSCRETVADEVKDKERANFCGYFVPRAGKFAQPGMGHADKARSDLEALFGAASVAASPTTADEARRQLDALFGEPKPKPKDD